jgi:acetolactate synthase-1/2/3 large subunit
VEYLYSIGVNRIYGISGGANASITDGIVKFKKIDFIPVHHEQNAGFAAFGESKYTNKLSVVTCITGCGGTNCITPLLAAWQDSTPILFISGNVNLKYCTRYLKSTNIRKFGLQDNDIIENVKSLCKYSKLVEKPDEIAFELEKAINIATSGRFGPVWLDLPSDIQSSLIDKDRLEHFIKNETVCQLLEIDTFLSDKIDLLKNDLQNYEKPLILAGAGVRLSGSQEQFKQFIEKYQIPFVATYLGFDLIDFDSELNFGQIGIKGHRVANKIINECDLLLVFGCSLNISQVGYNPDLFSPSSKKWLIDIEENNINLVKINEFIRCDLKEFLSYVNQ